MREGRDLKSEVLSLVASMAEAENSFEVPPPLPDDRSTVLASLTGRRLGAYEVLAPIGTGGMGEVYKARDTRLERIVAIKVQPAGASADPISRQRMSREARAVAALNHPHICAIYDVGSADDVDYFVMEFVDGETLATRLSRGELPIAETLRYAEQIAAALGEAHRAGIVHRDVKPANIMLHAAPDGSTQAKLLDFGVAKAKAPEVTSAVDQPQSDTAVDLTIAGFIVGTPYYMAPEQLDRNAADRRTDIFAFGAVLFEMLTGRKAFEGTHRNEVLGAIRSGNVPAPSRLRAYVPAVLDRIVMRCLAPDPGDRYQNADELLMHLRAAHRLESSKRRRAVAAAVAVLLLAAGGVIAWALSSRRSGAERGIEPSLVRLPASAGVIGAPALSPDGSTLVFSWLGQGIDSPELMLLPVGSTTTQRLTNDPGNEEWPAWSPDGKQVAFIRCTSAACGIFALRIDDRAERKLRDLRLDRHWGAGEDSYYPAVEGNRLVFVRTFRDWDFSRITVSNGKLESPAPFPSSTRVDLDPAFSPDGRKLAFVSERAGTREVWVSNADGSNATQLTSVRSGAGRPSWSPDGRHLAFHAAGGIQVMSAAGGSHARLAESGEMPTWSADGKWIYFIRPHGKFILWKVPVAGGPQMQVLTSEIFAAREGIRNGDLYFVRTDGIWRRSPSGAQETLIIPDFTWSLQGYWALFDDGIYYVLRKSLPDTVFVHHLKFYEFARGQSADLGTLTGHLDDWVGGLTVSPNRRTVVYSHRTYESSEIVLVENFR